MPAGAAVAGRGAHGHHGHGHGEGPGVTRSRSVVVSKLEAIELGLRQKDKEPKKMPFIKTPKADSIFGVVILLNAAFIGLDLEFAPDGFSWGFWCIETFFLFIFLIELVMRVVAEFPTPWHFFWKGYRPEWWGIFDFSVTILGCVDAWIVTPAMALSSSGGESPMSSFTILRVFRLLRLARLIRVLRMFNELVVLVQTLGQSLRAVGWMSLLLGMIIYTGSVICVILLGEPNRDNEDINEFFGSLGDALFSHFCVVTLEGWPDIAKAAMEQNPLWALYFVAMITLTNFALVNLMVGVIVERIIHFSLEQETELSAFVAESAQFRKTLEALFYDADLDHNGQVTKDELRIIMQDSRTHEIMTAFGINLDIPPATLFTIMDLNTDGVTTFEEFFNACMRLCGSKSSIHSIFVQHDICEARRDVCQRLSELESYVAGQAPGSRYPRMALTPAPMGMGHSSSDASREGVQASPEDCVTELLERMDRFGQVQLQICAEIEALKDQARGRSGADGGSSLPLLSGPNIRETPPRELGACCAVDALFSRRKDHSPDRNRNLGKLARKELEAEFRKAKK